MSWWKREWYKVDYWGIALVTVLEGSLYQLYCTLQRDFERLIYRDLGDIMRQRALLCILYFLLPYYGVGGQQTSITFDTPQAQTLYDEGDILGRSTSFPHPFSLSTFTKCDEAEIAKVFDSEFQFQRSYDVAKVGSEDYRNDSVRVVAGTAYRKAKAIRTIDTKILSARGCVLACITEKEFVCRDCDYFKGDGGTCALYNTTALVYQESKEQGISHPFYAGDNPSSDHYILYKRTESPPPCDESGERTHDYLALGWKAMEAGWYILAHDMLDKAIAIDPDFSMAYVGKILAHERMGYGVAGYKDKLDEIATAPDFQVKHSKQEQLLIQALIGLHSASTLDEGLKDMIDIFSRDTETYKTYILNVIDGNAQLLYYKNYRVIEGIAKESNTFALQLLTHNLNPYKNGKDTISAESESTSTTAIFDFKKLKVRGAWQIYADCTDIAEYYARWSTGRQLLVEQKDFLYRNVINSDSNALFKEDGDYLVVHRMNVRYMSRSLQRINEYERFHFFQLQLARFREAESHLKESWDKAGDSDEQLNNLLYRMTANAYFSTYDYIYDSYARDISFTADWVIDASRSTDDLALASRAYYWTAAAVQKLYDDKPIDRILTALTEAKDNAISDESYKKLLEIYILVVTGTKQRIDGDIDAAITSAKEASKLQDELVGADFTIQGNEESEEFKMLIPLGYQFEADIFRSIYLDKDDSVTIDSVINAYGRAVNSPPLNTSRVLFGYAESLFDKHKDDPKHRDDPDPAYVLASNKLIKEAWVEAEVEGTFAAKNSSVNYVEHYFDKKVAGCLADTFQIKSEDGEMLCWGGYIIIGVAVAVVVIIVIIVGILCLRRKAKAPQKSKEKEEAFIFSGPNLSRQDSFGSASPIPTSTLNRSSPQATPYASQTLSIQRPFRDDDYTQRSHTIGGAGHTNGDFELSTAH